MALVALTCLYVLTTDALCQTDDGVGIGTSTVDTHAALHIESPNSPKGILLPRWTTISNGHIAEDERLLAYHSTKNRFIFFGQNGGLKWMYLNPWLTSDVRLDKATYATMSGKIGVNSNAQPTTEVEVNGEVRAYFDLSNTDTQQNVMEGNGILPVGGIILWTGSSGTWPDNFVLCNGQTANSRTTPNLSNKFVVGGKNDVGATGGSHAKSASIIHYEAGGSARNPVTNVENMPIYYQVAFIMRVY